MSLTITRYRILDPGFWTQDRTYELRIPASLASFILFLVELALLSLRALNLEGAFTGATLDMEAENDFMSFGEGNGSLWAAASERLRSDNEA